MTEGEDVGNDEGVTRPSRLADWPCRQGKPDIQGEAATQSKNLFGSLEAEPIPPACQRDDLPGLLIIVGRLPCVLSLLVNDFRGTTNHDIKRLFIGKLERVPSRANVNPQQIRQAWRTAHAVDAPVGRLGQLGFSVSRVAGRRPRRGYPDGREQQTHGNHADRQDGVGYSERRNSHRYSCVRCGGAMTLYVPVCDDGDQVESFAHREPFAGTADGGCLRKTEPDLVCGVSCPGQSGCVF